MYHISSAIQQKVINNVVPKLMCSCEYLAIWNALAVALSSVPLPPVPTNFTCIAPEKVGPG